MPQPPIRPADDQARALAHNLIQAARHAALAVRDPCSGAPRISRVAIVPGPDGNPLSLMSDLAAHTTALRRDPRAALLIGEPGSKGDPMTHPRLSLQVSAEFIARNDPEHERLAKAYLKAQPKAKLYINFTDFHLLHLLVAAAHLNGGFGKAWDLTAQDLIG